MIDTYTGEHTGRCEECNFKGWMIHYGLCDECYENRDHSKIPDLDEADQEDEGYE